ncbi:hypothetical protein MIB92_10395 [Aestuariirhabdus sp. Z084]|uniref:hypothetical protein n=1 Tax=Aestuariirhabdus haliotis TaxID=2918751 RepID=UPI00201B40D8|nr:hypothetical protein [Aestuariirhabdus haliotis]MCL6416063.1 hypothetical protein [Aestuariirhabdus haliotis]MCL6419369.1 hypothetical protein [Aestuariirhabdus haliotis]
MKRNSMIDLAYFTPPSQGELELQAFDPGYTFNADRTIATEETIAFNQDIINWQEHLHAEGQQGLLLIYQAMDTAGKDNNIRTLFAGVNPQGIDIHSFNTAGKKERRFDDLHRYHKATPAKGAIGVFNRSYYEPLINDYARGNVDISALMNRAQHLNHFESLMLDSNIRVVKLYLHISRTEYRRRLTKRLQTPQDHWKLHKSDLDTHRYWHDTISAYQKVISLTHKPKSPWYIIPSNKQWFRDWLIGHIICKTLQQMNPQRPQTTPPYSLEDLEALYQAIDN